MVRESMAYTVLRLYILLTSLTSSDYNYIRNGDRCEPAGPEPIPADVCRDPTGTYMGSSGWRLIPGNTCDRSRGVKKDAKIEKECSQAQPEEGGIRHQTVGYLIFLTAAVAELFAVRVFI